MPEPENPTLIVAREMLQDDHAFNEDGWHNIYKEMGKKFCLHCGKKL